MVTIEIKNLTKIFPHPLNQKIKLPILSSLSAKFTSSKLNFVTGESGSGKSTLFNIIKGQITYDAGEIFINNQSLNLLSSKEQNLVRRNIIYMNQKVNFNIDYNLSIYENLKFNILLRNKLVDKRKIDELINTTLHLFHFDLNKQIHFLSGGELQKLSFIKSLVTNPKILLLDEPFSNLDLEESDAFCENLRHLIREKEILILISSHNTRLIRKDDCNFILSKNLMY